MDWIVEGVDGCKQTRIVFERYEVTHMAIA